MLTLDRFVDTPIVEKKKARLIQKNDDFVYKNENFHCVDVCSNFNFLKVINGKGEKAIIFRPRLGEFTIL